MTIMELMPFGEINPNELQDYCDADFNVGENAISVDLNFEEESIDRARLNLVEDFFKNFEQHLASAKKAIADDYELDEEEETARFYLAHHLAEMDESEILTLFGTTNIKLMTLGPAHLDQA